MRGVNKGESGLIINELELIDGKVDGKIPTALYEVSNDSVHNPDSSVMILKKGIGLLMMEKSACD